MLLDTNVVSELKRGRNADPRMVTWFSQMPIECVFTSVIVLGEIRRGIELVARRDKSQAEMLERWYASSFGNDSQIESWRSTSRL